jgi:tetratricopeptide (TPR) repeat protein
VADFAELAHGEVPSNPIAAMAEPMLVLSERDPEKGLAIFDRYMGSADPWVRAAAPMMRCSFARMLGRIDQAESDCRDSLAAFRALGDAWGAASVLIQLAEIVKLQGDFAAAVAALQDAASFGQELSAWGDLTYIDGLLAAVRIRMGDLDQAQTDLERAERAQAERSMRLNDAGAWLAQVRAELYWQQGDLTAAAASCTKVLAWLDEKQSPWWDGMHAQLLARLAMVVLRQGDQTRCRELLTSALGTAAAWVERPALADVVDAIAAFVLRPVGSAWPSENAALAATLLGAAHTIRGAFDESNLDSPAAREAARGALGEAGFDAAYERGRALGGDERIAAARGALAGPPAEG